MGNEKILVIDDDAELCELLVDYLSQEGMDVETVCEPERGLKRALEGNHAMVVLDVMLPGTSGFELLSRLREKSQLPVLMLTARGDVVDRVVGLEMGADDYLAKPFNPRELVARIRAIGRRIDRPAQGEDAANRAAALLAVGDIELDPATRVVKKNNQPVSLTSVEFSLLQVLLDKAGQVVSRDMLAAEVLGRSLSAYDRSIDVHVSALRRKLGNRVGELERIKTVRGVGYQYAALAADRPSKS